MGSFPKTFIDPLLVQQENLLVLDGFFFPSPAYRLEKVDKSVLEPTNLERQMT